MHTIQLMSRTALFTAAMFLMACDQKSSQSVEQQATEDSASEEIMQELKTGPVKNFPKTEDDSHDIAALNDYEERFQEMSADLEAELNGMRNVLEQPWGSLPGKVQYPSQINQSQP